MVVSALRAVGRSRLTIGVAAIAATAFGVSVASAFDPPVADNYVSDVTLVTLTTPTNSNSYKDADVYCPPGKKVIGGGGDVQGGTVGTGNNRTSRVFTRRNAPINGPPAADPVGPVPPSTGWRVTGAEEAAFAGTWSVKAFAICANVASPAPAPAEPGTGAPLEEDPPDGGGA